MSALLALDGVTVARGGRVLFDDLSLTLGPAGAALVTGPNGAGKSSLLRLIAGLLRAEAGTVTRGPCALVDGHAALDPELPLGRALGFWQRLGGQPAAALDAVLPALGLDRLVEVPVRLLSTGQRQRAALARVFASGAAVWLLDEPANGLDAASHAVLEASIEQHRRAGGAVVVATHIPVMLPDAVAVVLRERA